MPEDLEQATSEPQTVEASLTAARIKMIRIGETIMPNRPAEEIEAWAQATLDEYLRLGIVRIADQA
jgi:hypothetical protein